MNALSRNVRLRRILACSALAASVHFSSLAQSAAAPESGTAGVQAASAGAGFTAEQVTKLLPATVYFQGRTAPLQLRNAAATHLPNGQIVWASLVDSSGYATSVQEKYQFYLVTEGPLRIGEATVAAGAYGGGFVGDHFLLMDLGGHTVAQGPLQTDAGLQRPRPLQLQAQGTSGVRLYLGRRWTTLQGGGSRP